MAANLGTERLYNGLPLEYWTPIVTSDGCERFRTEAQVAIDDGSNGAWSLITSARADECEQVARALACCPESGGTLAGWTEPEPLFSGFNVVYPLCRQ